MHDRLLIIRSQARHAAPSLLAAGHFIQTTYRSLINTRDRINDGDNTESLSTNCVCFGIHSSREFFFKKNFTSIFQGLGGMATAQQQGQRRRFWTDRLSQPHVSFRNQQRKRSIENVCGRERSSVLSLVSTSRHVRDTSMSDRRGDSWGEMKGTSE
jgi:hypothetical protein